MGGNHKVIFLDVDGVLCFGRKESSEVYKDGLEKFHLKNLKRILDETGASIVLISVWRKFGSHREALQKAFRAEGIEWNGDSTGKIVMRYCNERPFEIEEYLDNHPEINKYAIIDDENHSCFGEHMFHVFVTSGEARPISREIDMGLTPDVADKVIAFLNQ